MVSGKCGSVFHTALVVGLWSELRSTETGSRGVDTGRPLVVEENVMDGGQLEVMVVVSSIYESVSQTSFAMGLSFGSLNQHALASSHIASVR